MVAPPTYVKVSYTTRLEKRDLSTPVIISTGNLDIKCAKIEGGQTLWLAIQVGKNLVKVTSKMQSKVEKIDM